MPGTMLGAVYTLFQSNTERPDPHILEMRRWREVTHMVRSHVAG